MSTKAESQGASTSSWALPETASMFTPVHLGAMSLPNRFVMAPMTRSRANADLAATAETAIYYTQRVSAGLIITEGTPISPMGHGYPATPGIHTPTQIAAWRQVTDAVHAAGGRIAAQLWHVGRVSHSSMLPDGALPVGPSAIAVNGKHYSPNGPIAYETPRALDAAEIAATVADFAAAASAAREAGFDGVELHGANGYLIDQFLRTGTNTRTDSYGGSVDNRTRFLREVVEAVIGAWSADRVGVRLSPREGANDMADADEAGLFTAVARMLDPYGLAFLHIRETRTRDGEPVTPVMRAVYGGPIIGNGSYDAESAEEAMTSGLADAVAFGMPYVGNPDLVERVRGGAPIADADRATLYGGDARGYIDYPRWEMAG